MCFATAQGKESFPSSAAGARKDVRILSLASETLSYEVCKCVSLRVWRRLDASMKWESLKVHKQIGISNMAAGCESNNVCVFRSLSAATPQDVVKQKQTIRNQTNRLTFST